jgi:peptide/nickel transport system substrate-binding protein
MQSNPLLTALKAAAFVILALLVFLSFWQKTHVEDQVAKLSSDVSVLSDRIAENTRILSDLKQSGGVAPPDGGTRPASTGLDNAALDANPDPSKPPGTPGRYRNFLKPDPDPEVDPASAGHKDGEIGLQFGPEPKNFNVLIENTAPLQDNLEKNVCDRPADEHWKYPYDFKSALCTRVEVSPDLKEYTLFFRRGAKWHTPAVDLTKHKHLGGTHYVTARDYKFTIDLINNPQTDCAPKRSYYSDVESMTLVDDHTLVVRWKKSVFHSIGFTLTLGIVPEFLYAYGEDGKRFPDETIGQQFNDHYYNKVGVVGCGPYRMASYEKGQWIHLERFEDWYGIREGVQYGLKRIHLLIYRDPEILFSKFLTGEVGISGMGTFHWKEKVLENKDPKSPWVDGRIRPYKGLRPSYQYFGWKNTHPLFRDKRVRKALTLALNREEIIEKVLLGHYRVMAVPIFPESKQADPSLKPLPFDLKAAAELLEEAGWKLDPKSGVRTKEVDGETKRFEFDLMHMTGGGSEQEAIIDHYKNDLLSIGIVMKPKPHEFAEFVNRAQDRRFEAVLAVWATETWDHDFDQVWHSKHIAEPQSSNYVEFNNPDLDRLSDELRAELDIEKRGEKVRAIGRILHEEQPCTFFGWAVAFGARWSWLQNSVEHTYKMRPFIRPKPMWVDERLRK